MLGVKVGNPPPQGGGAFKGHEAAVEEAVVEEAVELPLGTREPPPGPSEPSKYWDNYKSLPMLELWTARTRNFGEPQVPD